MHLKISLSHQLIKLLGWLHKHEKHTFKQMILKAVENGLLDKSEDEEHTMSENMQTTLVDFFTFLEETFLENFDKIHFDENERMKLAPTLDKLDLHALDSHTVWRSLYDVKAQLNREKNDTDALQIELEKNQDTKRMFFEQLLENWQPDSQDSVH